jgi:hypothetical protein
MAYKILSNVIASGSQTQHMAGEIVDIPDAVTANSLIRRGLAEAVIAPATHVWGETADNSVRGGKSIAQKQAEEALAPQTVAAPAAPAAAPQTPQVTAQPQMTAPAAPQAGQPTAAQVTAAADSVK